MYGKIFSSMYEGSMVGAGATAFAVMGYAISKQQPPDFNVELNAKFLSAVIGEPVDKIEQAIEYLCAPDPNSRTDGHDGRRLIKVGAFTYHMVNGAAYHAIRNTEERKVYNRQAQAKYREKKKGEGVVIPELNAKDVSVRFQKPTLDDLQLEGLSEHESRKFLAHYESNGWKVGKNPMKSWKGAAAGWKTRAAEYTNGTNGSVSVQPPTPMASQITKKEQRDYVFDNCQ